MAKLSASGEWLVAENDSPTSGPVQLKINTKLRSASFFDAHICYECGHTFRTCECKACLKCGTPFIKYFGTSLIKGRSHCRVCASPVCVTCIVVIKGIEKVCTRCHLKQKEEEISTEKALSAICEAKFGLGDNYGNLTKLKTASQQIDALFKAAKKGLDHVILALLINFGCNVDSTDSKQNTPLFYAAEGGHLQSVVILLEKGADVKARNNVGWTTLHAVAWKGNTDNHTECLKYLIEMNADVVAESNTNETAGDVAERCHAKKEVIQILRAAEVEMAMNEMERKIKIIMGSSPTPKEQHFCRLILTLLKFIEKNNCEYQKKENKKEKEDPLEPEVIPKCHSLNSQSTPTPRTLCHKCRAPTIISPPKSPLVHKPSAEIIQRPQADVEPIIRTPSPKPVIAAEISNNSTKNLELLGQKKKLEQEKSEWEDRCRKLMASIAVSTKEHKKDIEELESQMKLLKEENIATITKCEATYTNKLSKMRQETELQLQAMEERKHELEEAQREVLQLQKNYKITWVPDELVNECQLHNCRAQFSKTNRKHHCRCCGRVFCGKCSQQKKRLDVLGYTQPVRVCSTCYDLVNDIFKAGGDESKQKI